MAAGEQQAEPIVAHRALLRSAPSFPSALIEQLERGPFADVPRRFPAQAVDGAVPRGGDQPARGAGWDAGGGPASGGGGERLLHRLLGEVDVAGGADERRHRPPVLLAEDLLDVR